VYLVRKQLTNKYYAMKVIKEGDMKQKKKYGTRNSYYG